MKISAFSQRSFISSLLIFHIWRNCRALEGGVLGLFMVRFFGNLKSKVFGKWDDTLCDSVSNIPRNLFSCVDNLLITAWALPSPIIVTQGSRTMLSQLPNALQSLDSLLWCWIQIWHVDRHACPFYLPIGWPAIVRFHNLCLSRLDAEYNSQYMTPESSW